MRTYLGIDVGTSGVRSCLINAAADVLTGVRTPLPAPRRRGACVEQNPVRWWSALAGNLDTLGTMTDLASVARVCLDATSSTLLLCDTGGNPLTPALMYNDARATQAAARISDLAPADSAAHGPSASLAKLLWLLEQHPAAGHNCRAVHQADWLLGRLCGDFGHSDENNALKLGYDPLARRWPDWLQQLDIPLTLLPAVSPPGTPIGHVTADVCRHWGFQPDTHILSGTTDSTASFIATGARRGEAVTALGSTLVLKVRSVAPVVAPELGVYSHRLGNDWLVGGASNTGGAVLQQFFSDADITRFTHQLSPRQPTGLDYYPLPGPGERFPVNDPQHAPRLTPRPADDARFFQGILEGITAIEAQGYRLLAELGAPSPTRVLTTGGGAVNEGWRQLREQALGVPVSAAEHQEAAYGAALLALRNGQHS